MRILQWGVIATVMMIGAAGCNRAEWYEAANVEEAQVGTIQNSSRFGEEIYFGAQPSEEDFVALAAMGVKTVVNLRTEAEMAGLGFDEEAVAHEAGLNYLNIPIGRAQPDEGTIELLHSIIDDENRRPMLIHCASSNRAGYVWATYRGNRTGLTPEAALEEGREAGMRSPILVQWVKDYLGAEPEAGEETGGADAPEAEAEAEGATSE